MERRVKEDTENELRLFVQQRELKDNTRLYPREADSREYDTTCIRRGKR